jgi:hypothetical protein
MQKNENDFINYSKMHILCKCHDEAGDILMTGLSEYLSECMTRSFRVCHPSR